MSFFKKIGKFVKKNVNLRNVVNVVKYGANLIPGVGGIVSTGIAAAQGAYEEQKARKEQERLEREAMNQVEMINNFATTSKPDMSSRLSASKGSSISQDDIDRIAQAKANNRNNNNNSNNDKEMSFFEKLENKTFKGFRYVLFALPVLIFLFKDKIFVGGRGRRR